MFENIYFIMTIQSSTLFYHDTYLFYFNPPMP